MLSNLIKGIKKSSKEVIADIESYYKDNNYQKQAYIVVQKMIQEEKLNYGLTEADIQLLRELKYKEELQEENKIIVEA